MPWKRKKFVASNLKRKNNKSSFYEVLYIHYVATHYEDIYINIRKRLNHEKSKMVLKP